MSVATRPRPRPHALRRLAAGRGDIIGMNVAASSGAATITGYAIPVARVLRIADAIVAGDDSGAVEIGYDAFLGVELGTGPSGATLAGVVTDGPAQGAGLGAGDTVTSLDGYAVTSRTQLRRLIARHDPGAGVAVVWTDAGGARHQATVTLGRAPVA
jgi:S1-C subfamily serine protease